MHISLVVFIFSIVTWLIYKAQKAERQIKDATKDTLVDCKQVKPITDSPKPYSAPSWDSEIRRAETFEELIVLRRE